MLCGQRGLCRKWPASGSDGSLPGMHPRDLNECTYREEHLRTCRGYTFAQSKDDISGTCLIVCVRNNTNPPDFQQHWLIVRSLHTFCRRRHFRTFSGPDKLMVQPLDPHVFSALSPDLVDLCGVQLSLVWHRPAKSCRSTLGRIEDDDASDSYILRCNRKIMTPKE